MSSSSSALDATSPRPSASRNDDLAAHGVHLLRRALRVLDDEAPEHAAMLRAIVAELDLRLVLGAESCRIEVAETTFVVREARSTAAVVAEATAHTLASILDDELSVMDALQSRRLRVVGAIDDLRRAFSGLRVFLHGLVRAPSGSALLCSLRELANNPEERK